MENTYYFLDTSLPDVFSDLPWCPDGHDILGVVLQGLLMETIGSAINFDLISDTMCI